jgi:multiple sugar transport system substrate-binding protein
MNKKAITKTVAALLVVIIIVLGVAGYFAYSALQPASEKVVIRFAGWGAGATEVEKYQTMINNFMEQNPNIIVKYEQIPQMFSENILASFGAGVAPDVFYVDSAWAPIFIERGALYPIDNLTTSAFIDQYYDYLLTPFTGTDGKVYGLPKDWSMLELYYNKALLTAAGWTSPPDTWDELVQCAKDIKTATGKPGLSLYYGSFNRYVPVATSNGAPGPWFTSAADAAWFDRTEVKDAMNYSIRLFTEGIAEGWLAVPSDLGYGWLGDTFGSESVGMVISGNWMIPFLDDEFPDFVYDTEWGIAPVPRGSVGRATMAYTVALGINADTEHPEEAWEFVEFMLGREGQIELVVGMGHTLPSIEGLETHPDMWPQHLKTLNFTYDTVTVFVWGPKSGEIDSALNTILESAMRGEITVAEAISSMKTAVEDAFAG